MSGRASAEEAPSKPPNSKSKPRPSKPGGRPEPRGVVGGTDGAGGSPLVKKRADGIKVPGWRTGGGPRASWKPAVISCPFRCGADAPTSVACSPGMRGRGHAGHAMNTTTGRAWGAKKAQPVVVRAQAPAATASTTRRSAADGSVARGGLRFRRQRPVFVGVSIESRSGAAAR